VGQGTPRERVVDLSNPSGAVGAGVRITWGG
jgi:hypothetical protein